MPATSRPVSPRAVPGWVRYLATVTVIVAGYYLLPLVGAAGNRLQVITYDVGSGSAVIVLLLGATASAPLTR